MSRPHRVVPLIAVLVVVALVAWYFLRRPADSGSELAASGTVEITEAALGFAASGRIERILVQEGDTVGPGQVLAQLDTAETAARLAQLRAQARAASAALLELERGSRREELAQARAAEQAARRTEADAEADLRRMRELANASAVSRQQVEKAELALELARAQREQAVAQLQLLETGPRSERIAAQRAQVAAAEAQIRALEATLANHFLRSEFPGTVSLRHREPGEAVTAGQPVLSVMNPDDRWVRIYIPEYRLGAIALGDSASIFADTFKDKRYSGRIVFISHQAEFTPRNVQTAEERVKLVYAVKVQVTGDSAFELKPGLPVDVTLTRRSSP